MQHYHKLLAERSVIVVQIFLPGFTESIVGVHLLLRRRIEAKKEKPRVAAITRRPGLGALKLGPRGSGALIEMLAEICRSFIESFSDLGEFY